MKPQQEPVWEPEWEVQRLFSVLQDPQWPPPIHGRAMTDQREQGAQQMPDRESPPLVASMMSEQTADSVPEWRSLSRVERSWTLDQSSPRGVDLLLSLLRPLRRALQKTSSP
ncbi:MAG TPA: hypothetical protein PK493_00915 [Pseudomonadota bacterium]|nr:hypothetical protein [Pseudomonadota bacterium]